MAPEACLGNIAGSFWLTSGSFWLNDKRSFRFASKQSCFTSRSHSSVPKTNRKVQLRSERIYHSHLGAGSRNCTRDGGGAEARKVARSTAWNSYCVEGQHRHRARSHHSRQRIIQGSSS